MKIEKNIAGYGAAPAAIGYIIRHAPAVGDISTGGIWLFTCDPSDPDGEDTLQLLDLSEAQAMTFPSDADYELYLRDRSICFTFDWSGATTPRCLFERAGFMFKTVQGTFEDMTSRAHAWHFIGRSGGEATIGWGTRSEAEAYADLCDDVERERGNDVDLYAATRLTAEDIERIGDNLSGDGCFNLEDELHHAAGQSAWLPLSRPPCAGDSPP